MAGCNAMGCSFRNNRKSRQQLEFERLIGQDVRLLRFPKNPHLRELWKKAMNRPDFKITDGSRLCSRHFTDDCFEQHQTQIRLLPGALPTLFGALPRLKRTSKNRKQLLSLIPKEKRRKLWNVIKEVDGFGDFEMEVKRIGEEDIWPEDNEDSSKTNPRISLQELFTSKVGENENRTSPVKISEINLPEQSLPTGEDTSNDPSTNEQNIAQPSETSREGNTIIIFKERSSSIPPHQVKGARFARGMMSVQDFREKIKNFKSTARSEKRYLQQLLRRSQAKLKKVSVLASDLADAGLMHEEAHQMIQSALGVSVTQANVSSASDEN